MFLEHLLNICISPLPNFQLFKKTGFFLSTLSNYDLSWFSEFVTFVEDNVYFYNFYIDSTVDGCTIIVNQYLHKYYNVFNTVTYVLYTIHKINEVVS